MKNQQVTLKPQDLVILLKLLLSKQTFTYSALGKALVMSASEVHAGLGRARLARLITGEGTKHIKVTVPALREFVLHGARYSFPPVQGSVVRGVPTAYAGPSLRELFGTSDEPIPVWPYPKGSARGVALQPLYPSVPRVTQSDPQLYDLLTLFDALRIGAARERELAIAQLSRKLA